ncbi:MAG: hypothetical protein PHE89_00100 [Alphaproteobacteria bacterium]|nr:hypothetical protein [Alphaproteobacteria bacterium]
MKKSYFIFLGAFLLFYSSFILTNNAFAGVYFITKPQGNNDGVSNKPCQLMGYFYNSSNCGEGKSLFQKCPNGNTYKFCKCDLSLYPYTVSNCTETGKVLGGKVCDNTYYETCKCEDKYQYDTTNCSSPKTLSGNSCGGKYEKCTCPSTYSQTCSGNLIGVGTSCDGKYQSCKCNSNFQKCDNGGTSGATSCYDSEGTKYSNCKQINCSDGGYVSSEPYNQNCTYVSYNGIDCYKNCKDKTCSDGGYLTAVPANQTCSTVSYFGLTCYRNCKNMSCSEGGYLSSAPSNQKCTSFTYNGTTCYKDCVNKNCTEAGYLAAVPTEQNCKSISYNGLTCYQNCTNKSCAEGGYLDAAPSNDHKCNSTSYAGKTCYKDCQYKTCEDYANTYEYEPYGVVCMGPNIVQIASGKHCYQNCTDYWREPCTVSSDCKDLSASYPNNYLQTCWNGSCRCMEGISWTCLNPWNASKNPWALNAEERYKNIYGD